SLDLNRTDTNRALRRQQLDQLHVANTDGPTADEEAEVDLIDAWRQAGRHLKTGVAPKREAVRRQGLSALLHHEAPVLLVDVREAGVRLAAGDPVGVAVDRLPVGRELEQRARLDGPEV